MASAQPVPTPTPSQAASGQSSTPPTGKDTPKEPAKEQPKEVDKKRLYVRWEVTDEALKTGFNKFGTVTEALVFRGPRFRAFGFLTFESEEAAAKAMAAMQGKDFATSPLVIEYAEKGGRRKRGERKDGQKREGGQGKDGAQSKSSPGGAGGAGGAGGQPGAPGDQKGDQKGAGEGRRGRRRGPRRRGGGPGSDNAGPNGAGAGAQSAAAVAGGAPSGDGGRGRGGRGRNRRGGGGRGGGGGGGGATGGNAGGNAGGAGGAGGIDAKNDPNWGKVVKLNPDPITNPIAKDAEIAELKAGQRLYKAGRSDAKQIASLVLNADPTKGPFNCDFKLGLFNLKLLSVQVVSKEGDTRVTCRVLHPETGNYRDVYLRVRGNEQKHKFLELRLPTKPDEKPETETADVESFFVTIDSIQLDVKTGLWKKIMLSLMSMMVPRRSR
jgi:hypothetical protein